MGDRSHIEVYSMLLAFLQEHGQPLIEHGSAELGISRTHALTFIELLRANHCRLLGVELWRLAGKRLELDISEIWYSNATDPEARYRDVEHYFRRVEVRPGDVFAIQFG